MTTPRSPAAAPNHATIRSHAERDCTDDAPQILERGIVAHVGFVDGGRPVVIPMTYQYSAAEPRLIYLHGGRNGRLMKHLATGAHVSVAMTMADGLVYSKTALDHSVNYRSVVLFGRAAASQPGVEEKRRILDAMIARYFPGRTAGTDYERASDAQLEATALVAVEIQEWSAKQRDWGPGGPADEDPARLGTAGVIPLGRG